MQQSGWAEELFCYGNVYPFKDFLLVYVVGTFKCTFMTSYPYGLSMLVVCDADVLNHLWIYIILCSH